MKWPLFTTEDNLVHAPAPAPAFSQDQNILTVLSGPIFRDSVMEKNEYTDS